jgi:hypothetical protein
MSLCDDAPPRCRFAAPPGPVRVPCVDLGGGACGPAEPVPSRLLDGAGGTGKPDPRRRLGFAFAVGF